MNDMNYEDKGSDDKIIGIMMDIHRQTMAAHPEPYQCQIGGKTFRFTAETAEILRKDGEWHECRIDCTDGEIKAEINLTEAY